MKRASWIGLVMLAALLILAAAACSSSPKSRADDLIGYMPAETETNLWERDDTAKLLGSTVTSKGHAIMTYEGPDDALAYIVVEVFPTDDAAEVAVVDRERLWLLQGMELDSDRAPRFATATVAQAGRVRYALFQEVDIVVEINALSEDAENPVSDEAFDELLTLVREALAKVAG